MKKSNDEKNVPTQDDVVCSVCGRKRSEVHYMFGGETDKDVHICDECVEQLHYLNMSLAAGVRNDIDSDSVYKDDDYRVDFNFKVPTPHEIVDYLNQYVIGQEEAKKTIAVAVYNHYKRINQKSEDNSKNDEIDIEKSNILLCGETGSGKTILARTIAKMLDVPFCIADATVFTEAGYVGEDVESILTRLLQACDYDVKKAEVGICYIDEIDKLGRKSSNPSITRDVNGEGVQQALLKLLEGTDVLVPPNGGRKHPDAQMVKVNTKNILFICGGAFVGIDEIIGSRMNKKSVGFNLIDEDSEENKVDKENLVKYIEAKDIKNYGFIPELIGRLPIITYVEKLDRDALKKILIEPKNAIIKQYKKLLKMDNTKLEIADEVYDYIVDEAIKTETGARGLRSIVERLMKNVMYDAPTTKPKKIVIDSDYIKTIDKKYKVA